MRTGVVAAAVVFLASCALVSGLGDLSRSDIEGSDAEPDSLTAETNPLIEAAVPADAGDSGPQPCNGFCDNFDDRIVLVGKWDGVSTLGAGDTVNGFITSTEYASAPHSAQFHIPAHDSGSDQGLTLHSDLPLTGGKMTVDLDMKIVGNVAGATGYVNLVEFGVGGHYAGSVTFGNGGVIMDYWVNYPDGGHVQPIFYVGSSDEKWHHLHYEALYDPNAGSIVATWDGAKVIDVNGAVTDGLPPVPTTFALSIGNVCRAPMPALDVFFDNIQVR